MVKGINENSIIIDLGANRGGFSKEMMRAYKSKCYAVEPNTALYEQLVHEDIKAFNYAITPTDGPVDFFISSNAEASSLIDNYENRWGLDKKVTIEGISFKTLLNKLHLGSHSIEILKVDIEGAEIELIEALTPNDVSKIKQVSIEFHDWLRKDLHIKTLGVIKKLVSLGFDAYTDAPHHGNSVEVLFLNKKLMVLEPKQRFYLWMFRRSAFLKYS